MRPPIVVVKTNVDNGQRLRVLVTPFVRVVLREFLTGKEFQLESSSSDIQTPVDSGSISGPSHILIQ